MSIRNLTMLFLSSLMALALSACSGASTPAPTPNVQLKNGAASSVSAEGTVVPLHHSTLGFEMGGRVVAIAVQAGDAVKAGTVLARLDDTAIKARVAQAEAALAVARAQLAQLRAGATAAERQAAQDALASARANLDEVRAGPTVEQTGQLKANLDNAQAAVSQAQARYDRIGGDTNPSGGMGPERLALQQATNQFLAAQGAYKEALNHPTTSEVQAAQSAVTQAESAVYRLDPTPEQIALAEAQMAQSQSALDLARVALQETVLAAPFDGSIVDSTINLGQVVSPGTAAFTLADLTRLEVETVDLAEVDVEKVSVGQMASIKLDALPDKQLTGRVVRIAQAASDYRGDKVFKATLDITEGAEAGPCWGMTASIDFAAVNK